MTHNKLLHMYTGNFAAHDCFLSHEQLASQASNWHDTAKMHSMHFAHNVTCLDTDGKNLWVTASQSKRTCACLTQPDKSGVSSMPWIAEVKQFCASVLTGSTPSHARPRTGWHCGTLLSFQQTNEVVCLCNVHDTTALTCTCSGNKQS